MSYSSLARVQKNSSPKAHPYSPRKPFVSKCLAGLPRAPLAVWKGRLAAALCRVSRCLAHSPSAPTRAWRKVLGRRWCVLMAMTVMMMDAMTNTMVNSMYFNQGTALKWKGSAHDDQEGTRSRTARQRCSEIFSPGPSLRRRQTQQPTC